MKMTENRTHVNGSSNLEIAQSNQDLILTKGKRKLRTWILIGVVCAVIIATCIAVIVLVVNKNPHNLPQLEDSTPAISLGDILVGRLSPKSFNATWVSGSELLYLDGSRNLVLRDLNFLNKPPTVILPKNDLNLHRAFKFELSSDKKYLLLAEDYQKVFRYSYTAIYTIVNLETKNKHSMRVNNHSMLQLVVWSPVGNAMALVYENNIYYKSSAEADPVQVTFDSRIIYNGIPDWVYEEEVFSSENALSFSSDGKKIAFGSFNDTAVPVMVIPLYGEPGSLAFQYPRANLIKYPKAGTPNPLVSLFVVDTSNLTSITKLAPPTNLENKEPILGTFTWADNATVAAIWLNRVQNEAALVTYETNEPFKTEIVKSIIEKSGWLELFTKPLFSRDGSEVILILSQDQGNGLGGFKQIARLKRSENSVIEPITKGAFVVTEILSWDRKDNVIYFLANTEIDPGLRHLYSVSTITKETKCLSCAVKYKSIDRKCLYNMAEFSSDNSFYTLTCGGPYVPEIAIYNKANKRVLDWYDNPQIRDLISQKKIPITRRFTYEIADGFSAQVQLKLPPNLDTSGNTKYPMLVNVYGGPDSYQVTERFNLDWGSYLAANKSIIYATIDGRGSGLKGDKILFTLYRKLGSVEIADQINVTRQIQETLPYVDAKRTAIWGWSYGGYASGLALATDKEGVFKCGISVAPVTDWTLYDSIYTERFMGIPSYQDNLKGYQESQLLKKYEGIRNKQYFLIHGNFDDNVHYQQSMMWAKVLEARDILFRQLSYPDEDHSLGSVRPHLYHSLEKFLNDCFQKDEK